LLTRNEFAELCEVTGQAITEARKSGLVRMTDDNTYDPRDDLNHKYIKAALTRGKKRRRRDSEQQAESEDAGDREAMELEKLGWDIEYTKERTRERQLKNAETAKEMIPYAMWERGLGHFASGMKTNVLTIGTRVARGDVELRDKIESATKASIDRTVEIAQREIENMVEQEIKRLAESTEEDAEDGSDGTAND